MLPNVQMANTIQEAVPHSLKHDLSDAQRTVSAEFADEGITLDMQNPAHVINAVRHMYTQQHDAEDYDAGRDTYRPARSSHTMRGMLVREQTHGDTCDDTLEVRFNGNGPVDSALKNKWDLPTGKAQAEIMAVRAAKPQHANSALLTMTVEELRGMSVADLQTLQQSAMMALSAHAQQLNTPPQGISRNLLGNPWESIKRYSRHSK